jgi:uncharacterized membrane protein
MELRSRVNTIDLLRGIIMIVMALDHTRDYWHESALLFEPTAIDKTTPAIFFTRWITHFCAPAFAFLSGISINLNLRKRGTSELVKYLLTRGAWLVLLDLTFFRFGLLFNFYYDMTFLNVLWMLGWCMIFMSAVIFLPYRAILIITIIIFVGHDAVSGLQLNSVWTILMSFAFVPPAFMSSYPIIPWLGIMMFGFIVGRLYGDKYDPLLRRRLLMQLGILFVVMFVVLRWVNIYGDPSPWIHSDRGVVYTIMSYFNVTKYPVSLQFSLMTLGPLMILLSVFESVNTKWISPAVVYGRVPLFYFIVHFYLIHAAALVHEMIKTGKSLSEIDFHISAGFGGITSEGGVSLFWVYVVWILTVASLYPVCIWYDKIKTKYHLTYL